jgi:leucyl-tRNA synthetase
MKTKSAFQEAFYAYWNDLRYYLMRKTNNPEKLVHYAIDTWVKLLAPFIPYSAEEIGESLGGKTMMCISGFPKSEESRRHPNAELGILLLENLVGDSKKILKLISQQVSTMHLYFAPKWQYEMFSDVVRSRDARTKTSEVLQLFFQTHPDVDKREAATVLNKISKNINELGETFLTNYRSIEEISEERVYAETLDYIEKQLGLKVSIHPAEELGKYDPKGKAKYALPFKPALYLE